MKAVAWFIIVPVIYVCRLLYSLLDPNLLLLLLDFDWLTKKNMSSLMNFGNEFWFIFSR